MTTLGDRMKRYELAASAHFVPRTPLIVRVDGRAFHSFTRGCDRPFDDGIVGAMREAAKSVAEDMQGFVIGYVQSDEATFMLSDFATTETQPWFGYDAAKVISISASLMTAHFNQAYGVYDCARLATFDARAFSVPLDDVANCFLWRMRDWERNSLEMLARAHYSHHQLHQKRAPEMHEMLHAKGVNWADLPAHLRNGTVLRRDRVFAPESRWGYAEWWEQIAGVLMTSYAPEDAPCLPPLTEQAQVP